MSKPKSSKYCSPQKLIWTEKRSLTAHSSIFSGGVRSIATCPRGASKACAGNDNMIKVWNTRTGKETLNLSGHSATVRDIVFSPNDCNSG